MGHIRLGVIPKTQAWSSVVAEFASSGGGAGAPRLGGVQTKPPSVAAVARQTLTAAEGGLQRAKSDPRLAHTFLLLTRVVTASREQNWIALLAGHGINLKPNATVFDLSAALQRAADDYSFARGPATDVGEIAQKAAGETLCGLVAPEAETLFGDTGEDLQIAVKRLSTKAGFSRLGQKFFGRFLTHFLNFYLSRITAHNAGTGSIRRVSDITAFNRSLAVHCEQSAAIVRGFSGEWFSKTNFLSGIDSQDATGFVAVALEKLKAELKQQAADD